VVAESRVFADYGFRQGVLEAQHESALVTITYIRQEAFFVLIISQVELIAHPKCHLRPQKRNAGGIIGSIQKTL
jgi:hypothetical protein